MTTSLTIGALARAAEVNVETVRYYQRVGLIKEPRKPQSGFRHYPEETIARIRFIKRAQQLGFTLQEIAQLLQLGDGRCADVRTRAEEKREQINKQIHDLTKLRKTLDGLIQACQKGQNKQACPIVQSLTGQKAH